MVGGNDYNRTPVQPRHPGAAPARLGLEAVRAGDRAEERHLAGLDVGVQEEVLQGPQQQGRHGVLRRQQLRGAVRGHPDAGGRDHDLGQLRLRGGRDQGRDRQGRQDRPGAGHPDADLDELRDDARRPQAGRDPARHGARLPVDRRPRPASVGHARRPGPRTRRHPRGPHGARDRHQGRQPQRGPQDPCPEAGHRRHRGPDPLHAWSRPAPAPPPRSASSPPARPGRPRTTAMRGSSGSARPTPPPSGSGTRTVKPMLTEFGGEPVKGGTFPAEIWRDFMVSADEVLANRKAEREQKKAEAAAARGEEYTPPTDSGDTLDRGWLRQQRRRPPAAAVDRHAGDDRRRHDRRRRHRRRHDRRRHDRRRRHRRRTTGGGDTGGGDDRRRRHRRRSHGRRRHRRRRPAAAPAAQSGGIAPPSG